MTEKPISPPPIDESFGELYPELASWLGRIPDNVPKTSIYTSTINPTSVTAQTVSRQTFTVEGIDQDDSITIENPELPTDLEMLGSYRVTGANTIEIPFWNNHATDPIDPGALVIKVVTTR